MNKTESESEKGYNDIMKGIQESLDNIDDNVPTRDGGMSDHDVITEDNSDIDDEVDDTSTDDTSDIEDVDKDSPIDEAERFKDKYYLEKKKRKSVLADRQKLEEENYRLKIELDSTINNSTELYGRDLYNDLEKIKNIRKQALLGAFGDPDDPEYASKNADILAEADDLFQKASYKLNEYEKYISNRDSESDDAPSDNNYEEQIKLTKAQEWLDEHPELEEGSYNYNPKIQKELGSFIKQFDRELKRNGREDEILTDAYLDVLDEFIDTVRVKRPKDGYTTSNVGGVRNNFSSSSGGSVRVVLQDYEKDFAKSIGISEAKFLEQKILDLKNKQGGQSRYE
jgi:hypothetical protein